jgi:hypothetical protein
MAEMSRVCPFLEESDPRCSVHLSLRSLEEALGLCAHRYEDCPIYREKLRGDVRRNSQADRPVVAAG